MMIWKYEFYINYKSFYIRIHFSPADVCGSGTNYHPKKPLGHATGT